MHEIERKWIVPDFSETEMTRTARYIEDIVQGYLGIVQGLVVRIRISTETKYRIIEKAVLTFKGTPTGELKATRVEIESVVDIKDAKYLLSLCGDAVLHKTRYYIRSKQHVFHVDQYLDRHAGCTIAELELKSEKEQVAVPDWCGNEVTGKEQYSNYWLAMTKWNWDTIHNWDEYLKSIKDGKPKGVSMGCHVGSLALKGLVPEPLCPNKHINDMLVVQKMPDSPVYMVNSPVTGDAVGIDTRTKKDEGDDE